MKTKAMMTALLLAGALALEAGATAASNRFGLGFILGNPSGLSLKIPSGPGNSVNVIAGWNLDGPGPGPGNSQCCEDGSLYLGADYVWYNYNLIRVTQGRLPLYYGPGLNATVHDDRSRVGFRFALGLEYQFARAPFDIFFEIAPGINVVPDTDGYVSAGLGARFFF